MKDYLWPEANQKQLCYWIYKMYRIKLVGTHRPETFLEHIFITWKEYELIYCIC